MVTTKTSETPSAVLPPRSGRGSLPTDLLRAGLIVAMLWLGPGIMAQGTPDPPSDESPFGERSDDGFGDDGWSDDGFGDEGSSDDGFGDDGFGEPSQGVGEGGATGEDGFDQGGFDQGGLGQDGFGQDSAPAGQIALPLSDLALRDARSELIVAIETRDHAGAKAVLERGDDIGIDVGKPSALATAALLGDRTMVLLLLQFGADPTATTDSPLLEAVRSDEAGIVEILLRAGAQVPGQSSHEELFGGALRGANREAIYDHLLRAGGDPAICLRVAVDGQRPDLAERCLAAGADLVALSDPAALITLYPNTERKRLLELAAAGGSSGSDRESLLARLLSVAVASGDRELVDLVLAEGAKPSLGDLALALEVGHHDLAFDLGDGLGRDVGELAADAEKQGLAELALALRERRRDRWLGIAFAVGRWLLPALFLVFVGATLASRRKRSPKRLHQAVEEGDERAVARLLAAGADPEGRRDGLTALHRAVLQGDPRVVSVLLRRGADGSARTTDDRGYTAFHLVAEAGLVELAQLLVRGGTAIEVRAADGETPLFVAAVAGQREMVEWLLDQGADVEKTMGRGSLLCHAVLTKSLAGVQLLLEHGAEPNPEGGRQPLLLAVLGGQTEVARALLAAGADPSIRDTTGKGLLEIAQQHQQTEVARLLQSSG